jgi:uncharacterized protein YcfJ
MSLEKPTALDETTRRQHRAGVEDGAASGATVGLLLGLAIGGGAVALPAVALGAVLGGALGKVIVSRISPEEMDPPAGHGPNVGMYAPDSG